MNPQDPQPPVAPQQPPTPQPYQQPASPKKGANKGLIIGLIAGGGALLLLIIGIVIALIVFSGPSRADYKKAYDAMSDVRSSYTSASSKFQSYTSGLARGSDVDAGDVRSALVDYRAKVDAVAELKALKDPEVKEKYNAYTAQNAVFLNYIEDILASGDDIATANDKCSGAGVGSLASDYSRIAEAYDKLLGPCIDSLESLSQSKNKVISDYAKELVSAYKEQQGLIEDLQDAYNRQDRAGVVSAANKISSQSSKFTQTSRLTRELDKASDEAEVKDELNALGELITNKSNGK